MMTSSAMVSSLATRNRAVEGHRTPGRWRENSAPLKVAGRIARMIADGFVFERANFIESEASIAIIDRNQEHIMKRYLDRILLVALTFTTLHASAAVLVYKGSSKLTLIGNGRTFTVPFNDFVIIDTDTATVGTISYTTYQGYKQYSTGTLTNFHIVQVSTANGGSYSGLAHPPSQCEIDQGFTGESIFLQGATKSLVIDSHGTTFSFAQSLAGGGHGYSSSNGLISSSAEVVAFDKVNTLAANNSGETWDVTKARLAQYVQSLGYNATSITSMKDKNGAEINQPILDPHF